MAQNLFPVIESPKIQEESSLYDRRYKKSFSWDMEAGDFACDGAHKVQSCDGISAYQTWCSKTVMTERYRCLAYPNEIGTQMEDAMKRASRRSCESAIERTIKEALMVNPRTEYVRGFAFSWNGDEVTVEFTVKGIQYEEFKLKKKIGGEEDEQQADI